MPYYITRIVLGTHLTFSSAFFDLKIRCMCPFHDMDPVLNCRTPHLSPSTNPIVKFKLHLFAQEQLGYRKPKHQQP
jgi:hypothetical protein